MTLVWYNYITPYSYIYVTNTEDIGNNTVIYKYNRCIIIYRISPSEQAKFRKVD